MHDHAAKMLQVARSQSPLHMFANLRDAFENPVKSNSF